MTGIVIVGVGGQGTLLTSKILGTLALQQGLDVHVSETHGMAQRGGSVTTSVRISDDTPLYSSIIEQGEADILLAFEELEGLRALPLLKEGGIMAVNTQRIMPIPVIIGAMEYPDDAIARIRERVPNLITLDAMKIATECGTHKALNIVLLGVISKGLPFPLEAWREAIAANVKADFLDVNIAAFERGRELA